MEYPKTMSEAIKAAHIERSKAFYRIGAIALWPFRMVLSKIVVMAERLRVKALSKLFPTFESP